jgi:hypothetical protein
MYQGTKIRATTKVYIEKILRNDFLFIIEIEAEANFRYIDQRLVQLNKLGWQNKWLPRKCVTFGSILFFILSA